MASRSNRSKRENEGMNGRMKRLKSKHYECRKIGLKEKRDGGRRGKGKRNTESKKNG